MAIIAGVIVDWQLSPRVITIPSSETEITIEDLQDTLLDLEDDVEGILHTTLRETSGGEDLGGGVSVGFTMELQNAVIAPAPRLDSESTGTATTANSDGLVLTDSAATFISDGVTAGATIVNFTDASVTSVISVVSETQLTHYALDDGTDNDWDMSDSYKVWNEVEFNITGGNLVAVDGVGSTISPIRATFGNEIIKTSSSSATNSQLESIQYSSFNGGVTIDTINGTSGTDFPSGTPEFPVDNMTDAETIASTRGFTLFHVKGNLSLSSVDFSAGRIFLGQSITLSTITVVAGANVTNCEFRNCTLTGVLDGGNTIKASAISSITFVDGVVDGCILNAGTITLGTGAAANFINCVSGVAGVSTPIIDMGGTGQSLTLRNYSGGIQLINKSGSDDVSIDLNSGQVTLASTVTAGTLVIRGVGKLTDNSVGATVLSEDLLNKTNISAAVWNETVETGTTTKEAIRYLLATMAGEATGGGTTSIVFKNTNGDSTRVTMTVDAVGNRSAISLNS